MAGSYNHCVTGKGKLRDPRSLLLDNGGDYYEAVEEMYGMIWFLADQIRQHDQGDDDPAAIVEEARTHYRDGLALSPGVQGRTRP